mgnify:CR=1
LEMMFLLEKRPKYTQMIAFIFL